MLKYWLNIHNLSSKDAEISWLIRIAKNHCNSYFNKRKKRLEREIQLDSQAALDVISVECRAEESRKYEEDIIKLRKSIHDMKDGPSKVVMKAFYISGKLIKLISLDYKLKRNTVLSHLRRGRNTVRYVYASNST